MAESQFTDEHNNIVTVNDAGGTDLTEQQARTLAHYHAAAYNDRTAKSRRGVRQDSGYSFTVTVPAAYQATFKEQLEKKSVDAEISIAPVLGVPDRVAVSMTVKEP